MVGGFGGGHIFENGCTMHRYFGSSGSKLSTTYRRLSFDEDLVIFFHIRPIAGRDQPSEWLPISSPGGEVAPVTPGDVGDD